MYDLGKIMGPNTDLEQKNESRHQTPDPSPKEWEREYPKVADPFKIPFEDWGCLFQSPVSKRVCTLKDFISFDSKGTLEDWERVNEMLLKWINLDQSSQLLEDEEEQLKKWLETGQIDSSATFYRKIVKRLGKEGLTNEDLIGRYVCRLVRCDQLYYDPHYQTVYQLTPAQARIINEQKKQEGSSLDKFNELKLIRERQRLSWSLSEPFQSLMAMFDSDLGREISDPQNNHTKEFLRVRTKNKRGKHNSISTTPAELNRFSPLRYWSPPGSFANSVFHMLIWKPIITGKDLYGRKLDIPEEEKRLENYFVVVNDFNTAKFRIPEYAKLFKCFIRLAEKISEQPAESPLKNADPISFTRKEENDLLFFAPQFSYYLMPHSDDGELEFPMKNAQGQNSAWDLAEHYHNDSEETKMKHLLLVLRDRMLELILWSRYQQEIRSVGLIPAQRIFSIDYSTEEAREKVANLIEDYKNGEHNKLEDTLKNMLRAGDLSRIFSLKRVYDRVDQRSLPSPTRGDSRIPWMINTSNSRERAVPQRDQNIEFSSNLLALNHEEKVYYGNIEPLDCLYKMVKYYQMVYQTIMFILKPDNRKFRPKMYRLSTVQVREFRRYINSDLEHLSLEFYLDRAGKALDPSHRSNSRMKPESGFSLIKKHNSTAHYTYLDFMADSSHIFSAIHSHLVSINRALGDLYYNVTELPLSSFTPIGKSEIIHLTSELNRIMRGLLVATHQSPQVRWQNDIANYLMSVRSDCERFFHSIPQYYASHRARLIVFPLLPEEMTEHEHNQPYEHPISCLPLTAGVYVDFLHIYQNIASHVLAVLNWSIRLRSKFYFVPRRYIQSIAPT